MQAETMPYQWFVECYVSELKLIRSVGLWQIYSARQARTCLLLLVSEIEEVVVKCQYESALERAAEIDLLHRLPEGEADADVTVRRKPVRPVLPAGQARAMPPKEEH